MRRLLLAALLTLFAGRALADGGVPFSISPPGFPGPTFDIAKFGAQCNSTGPTSGADPANDDAAAFTSAVQAAGVFLGRVTASSLSGKKCAIKTTINGTGLSGATGCGSSKNCYAGVIIDIGDVMLECETSADVCWDAIGSKGIRYASGSLTSVNTSAVPTFLMQIGTYDPAVTASQHDFYNWDMSGGCSQAIFADFGGEEVSYFGGRINPTTNNCYGFMANGDNWNNLLVSHYQTVNWTWSSGSQTFQSSMNDIGFYGTRIQQQYSGGWPDIWLDGTTRFYMDPKSYISTNGATNIVLFNECPAAINANTAWNIQAHMENTNVNQNILVSGTCVNPFMSGTFLNDQSVQASFGSIVPDFAGSIAGSVAINQYITLDAANYRFTATNGSNSGTWHWPGAYTGIGGTIAVGAGGTCTPDGAYVFTATGGLGDPAYLTATVTAGVITVPALSPASAPANTGVNVYETVPSSPVTLSVSSGGSCSVAPTITYTTTPTANAPFNAQGDVWLPKAGVGNTSLNNSNGLVVHFASNNNGNSGASIRHTGNQDIYPNLSTGAVNDTPTCLSSSNAFEKCLTAQTWTVTDQSGASLAFTSVTGKYLRSQGLVQAWAAFTYPTTADGSNAVVSLPIATPNNAYVTVEFPAFAGTNASTCARPNSNASTAALITCGTNVAITNATLSAKAVRIYVTYPDN